MNFRATYFIVYRNTYYERNEILIVRRVYALTFHSSNIFILVDVLFQNDLENTMLMAGPPRHFAIILNLINLYYVTQNNFIVLQ